MGGEEVISPKLMRLYVDNKNYDGDTELAKKKLIPDVALLSDHDVKNDDIVFVTFLKDWQSGVTGDTIPEEDGMWEDVLDIIKSS
jgi:hypothetical protein